MTCTLRLSPWGCLKFYAPEHLEPEQLAKYAGNTLILSDLRKLPFSPKYCYTGAILDDSGNEIIKKPFTRETLGSKVKTNFSPGPGTPVLSTSPVIQDIPPYTRLHPYILTMKETASLAFSVPSNANPKTICRYGYETLFRDFYTRQRGNLLSSGLRPVKILDGKSWTTVYTYKQK